MLLKQNQQEATTGFSKPLFKFSTAGAKNGIYMKKYLDFSDVGMIVTVKIINQKSWADFNLKIC